MGKPDHVRHALPDPPREEREDAHAPRAERRGLSNADRQRGARGHGGEEAGRARGVRAISAIERRSVAHRRAVAARRSLEQTSPVVHVLAEGQTGASGAGGKSVDWCTGGPAERKSNEKKNSG